jgi:hypothetical protein
MIDLPPGKTTYWFIGVFLLVIFAIAAFGVSLAVKNEVAFRGKCEAKGGEVIYTKSGMTCFNKEVLIKE